MPPPKPNPAKKPILELISRKLGAAGIESLTPEEREILEQAFDSHRERLRVFQAAVATERARRVTRLFRVLDEVQEELFQSSRISGATTRELIDLYRTIGHDISASMEYIGDNVRQESLAPLLESLLAQTEETEELDTEQRKRVRAVIEQLRSAAGKDGKIARQRPKRST